MRSGEDTSERSRCWETDARPPKRARLGCDTGPGRNFAILPQYTSFNGSQQFVGLRNDSCYVSAPESTSFRVDSTRTGFNSLTSDHQFHQDLTNLTQSTSSTEVCLPKAFDIHEVTSTTTTVPNHNESYEHVLSNRDARDQVCFGMVRSLNLPSS